MGIDGMPGDRPSRIPGHGKNMRCLYLTADRVGVETGGGKVTLHEMMALQSLGHETKVWDRELLDSDNYGNEPWKWDGRAFDLVRWEKDSFGLVHVYAGTWPKTIKALKETGAKVCVTIAAHCVKTSKQEHEKLGIDFNYPHLVQPDLWSKYIEGYRLADVIVCPGSVPAQTVRNYGKDFENKRIEIIPHGCSVPKEVKPQPKQFTLGYLGSLGVDKGVRYLLEAWKRLNYKDATLVIAGRDSNTPWAMQLIHSFGGGNIQLMGWVKDTADFYNRISVYCQPSMTEGFGCEIPEAMSFARPVICSDGAGAVDCVPKEWTFKAGDVDELCYKIQIVKDSVFHEPWHQEWRRIASNFTWEKVKQKYVDLWKGLINERN